MAQIKASTQTANLNPVTGGNVNGAQNGVNVTVTPQTVELGGNLIRDTLIDGTGGGKQNNFIWDLLANHFTRNVLTQIFRSLQDISNVSWFESITRSQIIQRAESQATNTRIQENWNYNTGATNDQGWAVNVNNFGGASNFSSLQVEKLGVFLSNDGNPNGVVNIVPANLPIYANDAAADADANLISQSLYKITGDRTVYQKP